MQGLPLIIICLLGMLSLGALIVLRFWYQRVPVPEQIRDPKLLHILIRDTGEYSLEHTRELFDRLHDLIKWHNSIVSLELIAGAYGMHVIAVTEERIAVELHDLFAQFYPDAAIDNVGDYTSSVHTTHKLMSTAEFGLKREFAYPVRRFDEFSHDPLGAVFAVLQNVTLPNEFWLQLVLRPAPDTWKPAARKMIGNTELAHERMNRVEQKLQQKGFQFIVRGLVKSDNFNVAGSYFQDLADAFGMFDSPDLNSIAQKKQGRPDISDLLRHLLVGRTLYERTDEVTRYEHRVLDHLSEDVITPSELAGLWHVPDIDNPVELTPGGTELMIAPGHDLQEL
ncbi:MAG: hypothetical protein TR69_WS6001001422 [candidate division WS6 bacterium OLB20]|uniref:DUF8128 domain-containing protein n=1 Tax=candidate division WS6 bacterium OLB20 TaxID=1617426 RepID=A0A136LVZ7_9BACT|nr:MAG: hypothetical protein TR69_WS6001001422 [candidate division WS6 bacterium OLB20]